MSVKREVVEIHFCDICQKREDHMDRMSSCRHCGRDVCAQHIHLIAIDGLGPDWHTRLCDVCRGELQEEIGPFKALYGEAREPEPAGANP